MKSVLEIWSEKVKANKKPDENSSELLRKLTRVRNPKKIPRNIRSWVKSCIIRIEYYGYGNQTQLCWQITILNKTASKCNKFFKFWVRDHPDMRGLYLRYGYLGQKFKKIF